MRCCARCRPSSLRSRSSTDLWATSRRSVSIGSAPRRADARESGNTPFIPAKAGSQIRKLGPRFRGDERSGVLLRREADLGSGRAHVGIDVLLVFDEVLLEHAYQLARGLVERGFILPGLHRIEQVRL